MSHIVKIIGDVAWPLTVIALAFILRKEFRELVARLSSIQYKDLRLEFEKALRKAEKKAAEIPQPTTPAALPAATEVDRLYALAEVAPKAAVIEAWSLIESAAASLPGFRDAAIRQRLSPMMVLEFLETNGRLTPETKSLLMQLLYLRNRALHVSGSHILRDDAQRYIDLATKAAAVIRTMGQQP